MLKFGGDTRRLKRSNEHLDSADSMPTDGHNPDIEMGNRLMREFNFTKPTKSYKLLSKEEEELPSEIDINSADFEKRGVKLDLLLKLGDIARSIEDDEDQWTIGRISNELLGTHELLHKENRWNVKAEDTLTYHAHNSLIETLRYDKESKDDITRLFGYRYDEVVANATVFVSFPYKASFFELLGALQSFLEDNAEHNPSETYFWVDAVVNNQWLAAEKPFDWWKTTFKTAIADIGNVVVIIAPWDKTFYTSSAWCMFELFCSIDNKSNVYFSMSRRESQRFMDVVFFKGIKLIDDIFSQIDVKTCTSFKIEDRASILEVVESSLGGTEHMNQVIFAKFRELVLETSLLSVKSEQGTQERQQYMLSYARLLRHQAYLRKSEEVYSAIKENLHLAPEDAIHVTIEYCEVLITNGNLQRAQEIIQELKDCHLAQLEYSNILLAVRVREVIAFLESSLEEYASALIGFESCFNTRLELQGLTHNDTVQSLLSLADTWIRMVNVMDLQLILSGSSAKVYSLENRLLWKDEQQTSIDWDNLLEKLSIIETQLDFVLDRMPPRFHPLRLDVLEKISRIRLKRISFQSESIEGREQIIESCFGMLKDSLKMQLTIFGSNHPHSIQRRREVALVLQDQSSIVMLKEALDSSIETLGESNVVTIELMVDLAVKLTDVLFLGQDRFFWLLNSYRVSEAVQLFREAIQLYTSSRPSTSLEVIRAQNAYVKVALMQYIYQPCLLLCSIGFVMLLLFLSWHIFSNGGCNEVTEAEKPYFNFVCLVILSAIIAYGVLAAWHNTNKPDFYRWSYTQLQQLEKKLLRFRVCFNFFRCCTYTSYKSRRLNELNHPENDRRLHIFESKYGRFIACIVIILLYALLFSSFSTVRTYDDSLKDSSPPELKFTCPSFDSHLTVSSYCGVRTCCGGVSLVVSLCSEYSGGRHHGNTFISLFNGQGEVVAFNDDGGSCGSSGGSQLSFITPISKLDCELRSSSDCTCQDFYIHQFCYQGMCNGTAAILASPKANVSYFEIIPLSRSL